MKHVPVTVSDAAQPLPPQDAEFGAGVYDPARERAVARRLRGARRRRLALAATAIVIAAAAAGSFTIMNRDKIRAELAPARVANIPAPEAPALASSTSRPVQLSGTGADPNKVQARVIVPADPEPQPIRPPVTDPAPVQMQDTQTASAPRTIPLSSPTPARSEAPPADDPAALPATALGFAPVPAPRPSRAP